MNIVLNGKAYRLTCNQAMAECISLKSGQYQMVKLPKNFGYYDCQDVDVYAETPAHPDANQRLGEYCLEEK